MTTTLIESKINTTIPAFNNAKLNSLTQEICMYIEEVQNKATQNHLLIAQNLATINEEELYKEDGFKSCAEYAMQTFGWKRANAYAMIQVGTKLNKDELPLGEFSVSQYREMLPLDKEELEEMVESGEIDSDMSAKEIRETVNEHKPVKEKKTKEEPLYTWALNGVYETEEDVLLATETDLLNWASAEWTQRVKIKNDKVNLTCVLMGKDGYVLNYVKLENVAFEE